MSQPHPLYRVGPAEFDSDPNRLQTAADRYDEGKGLIGGNPERRPRWLHPLPAEPAAAFRLLESSPAHLERLRTWLGAAPLEIEIGSARGEFILDWAAQHHHRHFLAFEVKWKLMRRLSQRAERRGLGNLWVSDDDARYDLPRLLGRASVDVFHILFPDPWWKPKHQARRLFTPPFVDLLAALLRPGGILRVATDVPGYGQAIEDLVSVPPAFMPNLPELAQRFATATPTSRQAFCDSIGRPYAYYHFTRRPTPSVDHSGGTHEP